jgi:hypothetical protein
VKHRDQHARLAFDEQRALDDLQRLHREIQRVRGERERAETDFDQFVRGFRGGAPAPASPPRGREPQVRDVMGTVPTSAHQPGAVTVFEEHVSPSAEPETVEPIAASPPVVERPQRPGARRFVVPIAVLAMIVGVFAVRARKAAPPAAEAPSPNVVSAPVAPPAAPPSTTPSPAAAPAAPETGLRLDLVTHRPVWVRVFVDGRRALEREIAGGQRLPLKADRTIVIRAGDAGAVSVVMNGRDEGKLGRDGAIATRAFSAPTR